MRTSGSVDHLQSPCPNVMSEFSGISHVAMPQVAWFVQVAAREQLFKYCEPDVGVPIKTLKL
jgi:hypothetical protein